VCVECGRVRECVCLRTCACECVCVCCASVHAFLCLLCVISDLCNFTEEGLCVYVCGHLYVYKYLCAHVGLCIYRGKGVSYIFIYICKNIYRHTQVFPESWIYIERKRVCVYIYIMYK